MGAGAGAADGRRGPPFFDSRFAIFSYCTSAARTTDATSPFQRHHDTLRRCSCHLSPSKLSALLLKGVLNVNNPKGNSCSSRCACKKTAAWHFHSFSHQQHQCAFTTTLILIGRPSKVYADQSSNETGNYSTSVHSGSICTINRPAVD